MYTAQTTKKVKNREDGQTTRDKRQESRILVSVIFQAKLNSNLHVK